MGLSKKQIAVFTAKRDLLRRNVQRDCDLVAAFFVGLDPAAIDDIKLVVKRLTAFKEQLETFDEDLLPVAQDLEDEVKDSTEVEENITNAVERFNVYLESQQPAPVVNQPAPAAAAAAPGNITITHNPGPKLPDLEIPKFSGNPLKWREFWDSFDTTFHSQTNLTKVVKFKYLKRYLEGEAARMVGGFDVTDAHYDQVIAFLHERYGDEQVAIFAHMEELLAMDAATSMDPGQLRKTYDECEKHIRSLVSLGMEEEKFGLVFTPIILSKLPKFIRIDLHRKIGSKKWTLTELRTMLRDEINARDRGEHTFGSSGSKAPKETNGGQARKPDNEKKRDKGKYVATVSQLPAAGAPKGKPACAFCNGDHFSDQCPQYPDANSRRARIKGNCFACLGRNHSSAECNRRPECYHCGQTGHHRSLCNTKFPPKGSAAQPKKKSAAPAQAQGLNADAQEFYPSGGGSTAHMNLAADDGQSDAKKAILQTAMIQIRGESGNESQAQCLLDNGSTSSCITADKAREIGAKRLPDVVLSVGRFMDKKRSTSTFKQCEFSIVLPDGKVKSVVAKIMPAITAPIQRIPVNPKIHPILTKVKLADRPLAKPTMVDIDILIGQDYYYDFVQAEQIRCADGLVLLDTLFGYVTAGTVMCEVALLAGQNMATMMFADDAPVRNCQFQLEKFWRLEDIGITAPKACDTEDEIALKNFNKSIQFEDGRYQAKLPWKIDNPELPDNYHLAKKRLISVVKRHQDNPEIWEIYDNTIQKQIQQGMVEVAPKVPTGSVVQYLPHHGVLKPGKTTPVRIVHDASAKVNKDSLSLNDCLFRGPVLLADLTGLLIRFRIKLVGLVADIEKAFHQVGLPPSERDALRFLWLKDPNGPVQADNIEVLRFCRVLFGITSGPFMLAATIEHHLKKHPSEISDQILSNIYVDNIVDGAKDPESAIAYYRQAKGIFQSASMNLRDWYTNSDEVSKSIPEADRPTSTSATVLGLTWDTTTDLLSCVSVTPFKKDISTKRQVLQAISGLYDPCGFSAPVSVQGKMLMQKLWKAKLDWDQKLPSELQREWDQFAPDLERLGTIQVPRYVIGTDAAGAAFELHCFCDASALAYAAVVYLRVRMPDTTSCQLLLSKSRVAPLKGLTIPRLELMAIVIGCRALKFVETQMQLKVTKRFIWSDSKVALHWVNGSSVKTVFVKHRVTEVRSHSDIEFLYVSTEENPADLPTRGTTFHAWSETDLWWHGPPWISRSEDDWPPGRNTWRTPPKAELEGAEPAIVAVAPAIVHTPFPIDPGRYSRLTQLLRVTSWIKRAITKSDLKPTSPILTASEIQWSKTFWIKRVQEAHFGDSAMQQRQLKRQLKQLNVFTDEDGILRCGGRFAHAPIQDTSKNPILLPKDDNFTNLIINDYHFRLMHAGVKHTLAAIRDEFWIIHGRSQVKKALHRCNQCKRFDGGNFRLPNPPPLPPFRLEMQKPFSVTGIDFLGPLYIRTGEAHMTKKVWICLFTCAVVRAIHLEVVGDLSTQEFLLSFRRFVSLNGKPKMVISDNGKQLVLAEKVLKKVWIQLQISADVQNYAATEGIKWKFITEHSPWMGGFYERLIKSAKTALRKTLNKKLVSLSELRTVVYEISGVLNTRPLEYVEDDTGSQPLTPAHFLGRSNCGIPMGPSRCSPDGTSLAGDLIKGWKRLQTITNHFWNTWKSSYLQQLREHHTFLKQRNPSNTDPMEGTVVSIRDSDSLPRGSWKIGIIDHRILSADGHCRSVVVRLSDGKKINRPIKLLYPLELPAEEASASDDNSEDEEL